MTGTVLDHPFSFFQEGGWVSAQNYCFYLAFFFFFLNFSLLGDVAIAMIINPTLYCHQSLKSSKDSQVKEEALKVSSCLRGLGLNKGDVVGVLLPNCIEYPLIVQVGLYVSASNNNLEPCTMYMERTFFFKCIPVTKCIQIYTTHHLTFTGRSSLGAYHNPDEPSVYSSR